MASQRVAQYESDTDTDDTEYVETEIVKLKMDSIIDGIWSISMTNNTIEGKRVYYRCNQVKRRAKQCPATIHLLYHNDSDDVSMFTTNNDHVHEDRRTTGIKKETKKEICELFKLKIKPKRILEILAEKSLLWVGNRFHFGTGFPPKIFRISDTDHLKKTSPKSLF
ncbi:hypothetical protein BpHYR1_004119 [Brachionus plicatilis]|uniref:Uncharacterized protein n=1 Tax=Brachionus plicatilis TaxID=10195 RepID=A0A3M7R1A9_BRAPC|nr:hypothetical protein BpHYR1_004119 [Brachionus plicatilis]